MRVSDRATAYSDLLTVATLLNSGCDDYLALYSVWDRARRGMDDFMDNPDWLERWVNETEKVEDGAA